jgi:hypothetical protein
VRRSGDNRGRRELRIHCRKDREAARLAAIENCGKDKAGECIVRATDCNK